MVDTERVKSAMARLRKTERSALGSLDALVRPLGGHSLSRAKRASGGQRASEGRFLVTPSQNCINSAQVLQINNVLMTPGGPK
jgi:hypothetical protein